MSSHSKLRLILSAASALTCAAPALAAGRECSGYDYVLKDKPAVEAGRIAGGTKTSFIKGEIDDKACPADTRACRRKAFLLPGDKVVVGGRTGEFVCATFVNGKGVETSGWLPKAAVTIEPPGAEAASSGPSRPGTFWAGPLWSGTWVREEASIAIKLDKGKLAIDGEATWGGKDPDRVKRGSVHLGNISAAVAPKDDRLGFAMGVDDKTLPVDTKDDTICKVWMQRVGDYLLVDDNNACGGMNVTFRGTYARR